MADLNIQAAEQYPLSLGPSDWAEEIKRILDTQPSYFFQLSRVELRLDHSISAEDLKQIPAFLDEVLTYTLDPEQRLIEVRQGQVSMLIQWSCVGAS